jgi:hypothetical protein
MKVGRVASPDRFEWIDTRVSINRGTIFLEPFFDSLVVVFEMISELAIRKQVAVIDVE